MSTTSATSTTTQLLCHFSHEGDNQQRTTNNEQPVLVGQVHGGTTAIWLLA